MKILNSTRHVVLAEQAVLADSFWPRLKGLLGRQEMGISEGLVITRCQSIHMFFMRFPIDIIFVDAKDVVVGIVQNIQPFQLSPVFWKADKAIELPGGVIARTRTAEGDRITFPSFH
ncbi:MAG: DUF192 domain-containing protein [Candidatus Omnitrophica bacterium]|nr:DUF192 domain-containing protein [Candidatus Omnitrophota bacterium]